MLTNNSHGGNHNHHPHHQSSGKQQQPKFCMKLKNPQAPVYASCKEINANNPFEESTPPGLEENNNKIKNEYNEYNDEDDDIDRAFKEIDDLYEYVRSGVLPEYLKSANNNETLGTTSINSRSKITPQECAMPSIANNSQQEHSSPALSGNIPSTKELNNNRNMFQNNNNHHHSHHHHHSLQNQNLVSSVTAVTTTVSGGGGNSGGGGDETRDHSELFDVSTTTNTRKTYKMSHKNSENISGSSSFRLKKEKGKFR